jgi:hypothetical protein
VERVRWIQRAYLSLDFPFYDPFWGALWKELFWGALWKELELQE